VFDSVVFTYIYTQEVWLSLDHIRLNVVSKLSKVNDERDAKIITAATPWRIGDHRDVIVLRG